jgi:hypothetical protein
MEMRSHFVNPFLPYLREDCSAQGQVSSEPGGGWFIPSEGGSCRLLPEAAA